MTKIITKMKKWKQSGWLLRLERLENITFSQLWLERLWVCCFLYFCHLILSAQFVRGMRENNESKILNKCMRWRWKIIIWYFALRKAVTLCVFFSYCRFSSFSKFKKLFIITIPCFELLKTLRQPGITDTYFIRNV